MCLSVYLGCDAPLRESDSLECKLGFESAETIPPPLGKFAFVYRLGHVSVDGTVGCSCLLSQQVIWEWAGPTVVSWWENSMDGDNPFVSLKSYVQSAQVSGKLVALACDDRDLADADNASDDYDLSIISADMISADGFLFADPGCDYPWRAFYLTPALLPRK